MKSIITCMCLAVSLAGCATMQNETPIAVDTYCITARKVQWSINDTPETIRAVEIHNRTIDLRCKRTV